MCFVWVEAAGKAGGDASPQAGQRTEIHFKPGEWDFRRWEVRARRDAGKTNRSAFGAAGAMNTR